MRCRVIPRVGRYRFVGALEGKIKLGEVLIVEEKRSTDFADPHRSNSNPRQSVQSVDQVAVPIGIASSPIGISSAKPAIESGRAFSADDHQANGVACLPIVSAKMLRRCWLVRRAQSFRVTWS